MHKITITENFAKRLSVFIFGLFLCGLGAALCTRPELGTSPIAVLPWVLNVVLPSLSFGTWTVLVNIIFILMQWAILRRDFKLVQLAQLPATILLGVFIDFGMWATGFMLPDGISTISCDYEAETFSIVFTEAYSWRLLMQLAGCLVTAIGIQFEVAAALTYLPGDGFNAVAAEHWKLNFGYLKITTDILLVLAAVAIILPARGEVQGLREGTLMAALLVGWFIKATDPIFKRLRNWMVPAPQNLDEAMLMDNREKFDVVVVGGGTAGVVAALAAARNGASTLLVERSGQPGGTITAAQIAFPGLFFAHGKQIIAGIGWELTIAAAELSGTKLPDFTKQHGTEEHWKYQVDFNPALYALLCEERMQLAGVRVLYHAMPAAAEKLSSGWQLTICTQEGLSTIEAKVLIDATGDASLAAICGVERLTYPQLQPATMSCRLSGYNREDFPAGVMAKAADDAVATGELRYDDIGWNTTGYSGQLLWNYGNNANHVAADEPTTAAGRSRMEVAGRLALLRMYRFLKAQPGMERLAMESCAAEIGVRESAVIVGKYHVTGEDYASGRRFPDAICNAFYPIDLHSVSSHGVNPTAIADGAVPTIPYRALLPASVDDLLVCGRCIASDRQANSALRVQAPCMANGQAAGTAAALVATGNANSPATLDVTLLRKKLAADGAIIP